VSESVIERLFREAASTAWWPEIPLAQEHAVTIEGNRYRLDFAVPGRRFGIELDGQATHSSATAIASDRKRQRALERAGWTISRFGGQEITRSPENSVWEAKSALSGLIAEGVSTRDRAWFTEHPQAHEYWRPLVPGEIPVAYAPGAKVLVYKMPWGRAREVRGTEIAGQPPAATPSMAKAGHALLHALAADHAVSRNEALGRPPGSLPDASHPAVALPASQALATGRAVFACVDGTELVFIPDGAFLAGLERETGTPLPASALTLLSDDGRKVYVLQAPGA
jgi:hypothetical protein